MLRRDQTIAPEGSMKNVLTGIEYPADPVTVVPRPLKSVFDKPTLGIVRRHII